MQKCVVRNREKGTVKARGNEVTLNLAKIASRKVEFIIKRCMGHLYNLGIVPGYWKNNWNVSVFRVLRASVVYA